MEKAMCVKHLLTHLVHSGCATAPVQRTAPCAGRGSHCSQWSPEAQMPPHRLPLQGTSPRGGKPAPESQPGLHSNPVFAAS